jgi:membrane protein CcdC involved in cytochrome C biogenesis
MRIAMLSVLMYHFPGQCLSCGVLFPLFIYGVVFILWVIWVSKFSLYAKILLSHKVRVTIGFIGSIALVVRAFEDELFYDPFELFQSDFNVYYRLMIRFTY